MKCPKCASRGTFIGDSNSLMRCSWCNYLYSADKAMQDVLDSERTRAYRAEARVKELERLAYIGDHHFEENTYKYRLDELIPRFRELESRIVELEKPKTCDGCVYEHVTLRGCDMHCVRRHEYEDYYTPRREGTND